MPDDTTWEEIEKRIRFIAGVQKAMKSMVNGKGVSKEEVKGEIKEWAIILNIFLRYDRNFHEHLLLLGFVQSYQIHKLKGTIG